MNLHEKSVGQRNLVERIAEKIPGFAGYLEKERRRDVDQMQRDFCANKLSNTKNQIKRVLDDLIMGGDIDGITPFEKLLSRVDTVSNTIRNAPRGYSGMFDAIKIGEDQLMKVYEFDLSLAEGVSEFEQKVGGLSAGDREKCMTTVRELIDLVTRIEDYFGKREQILRQG